MSVASIERTELQCLPDAELVPRAQRGDPSARETLARRYRDPAFRLALQLLGRPDEALDVSQDAMLRFFASLSRFQSDRPVLPWLFRIVRNRVRDLQRAGKRRRHRSLEGAREEEGFEPQDTSSDPEQDLQLRRLQKRVWRALASLSPAYREILVLRDYQDLSYAEIATVLGIPKGTVMSRLHSARRKLRERWLAEEELAPVEKEQASGGSNDQGM